MTNVIRKFLSALAVLSLLAACGKKEEPAPASPAQKPAIAVPVAPKPAEDQSAAAGTNAVAQEAKPVVVSTLAAYFHFDEERGARFVTDSSPRKRTARFNDGVAAGGPGMIKGALDFTCLKKGQVTLFDPLDFQTNTATVVAWVKRRGPQQENSAIFYARGGETTAGLLVGKRGELSYVWGREKTSEGWISGLVLPDKAWAFVAIVVEADKATLYLGVPGEPLWSAENAKSHILADFSGALTLGRDPLLDAGFEGGIDELGFWKNSMSRDDVEKLFLIGQKMAAAQKPPEPVAVRQPVAAPTVAAKPATKPATVEPTVAVAPKPAGAKPGWSESDFRKAAVLYNDSVTAFQKFLQTRENGAGLKRIEADVRASADMFEKLKDSAPASLDLQTYIDRCNKLNFDIHAAKTLAP